MGESLRKSGIDIIGDVPWGAHFCQFYRTREELIEILVPYFKAGLENNELCVWIISKLLEVEEVKAVMRRAVSDFDVYLEKGQIEIIPYTHGYLKGGTFDPEKIVDNWIEKIDQALARGYDGLRAAGDNRWLEKEGWDGFIDYENKVDNIIEKYRVIALCPYCLDMCSTAEIVDVVSNHQLALIKRGGKWERIDNSGSKRAEKEAVQAAKNWKYTFDAVPDLIAIIDNEHRIVHANRAMAAKMGRTPEECIGMTCSRDVHGTAESPSFCPQWQLLKGRVEHTTEVCEVYLGGNFLVSTSPLYDSEEKLIGSVYVARDIARRKHEEHRIRRYNRVLEGINLIFSNVVQAKTEEELGEACLSVVLEITGSEFGFINEIGSNGLLHDVAKSQLGWEQCFMYDKTGHRRSPSVFAVHGLYGSVINNKKGFFTNDPPSHPDSIGIPDGHPPITSFLGVPLAQGGKTIGLIAVANREGGYSSEQQEDLEAIAPAVVQALQRKKAEQKRKQVEEALQVSEERYRSLYENTLDGILLTKPDGTILCANPQACQMFGMTEDEIIRAGREGLVVNDEKLAAALEERRLTGRARAELTYRRKDGSTLVCDATSKLFVGADGNLNTSQIIRDISERKKAEEALRFSNLYNRSLIEASLDPLVTIGRDGKIKDVNGATEQVTGYSRNELIGTDFSEYFIDPEKARTGYRRVFTDGEVRDFPLEIQHKDGRITPVLYNASVYRDENGEVTGVFAAARDITERKKAEEALKEAHDSLEKLIEERTMQLEKAYNSLKESEKGLAEAQKIAHIGNWEWDIATDEAYWSDELYRIYGCSPQESGATYDELFTYVHPDDREYVATAIEALLKGKPYGGIDYRMILANGEERIVHAKGEVVFDEKNTPIRVKGITQDITERKKSEEKIQILANIVKSSNDAIGTISLDDIITSWNEEAEQVYGYSAEEILGKHTSFVAPPHLDTETKKLSELIKQGKKIHHYETSRLRKDGKIIDVSITLSPVFDSYGKLNAISFISRDITERKRVEEKLRESEEKYRNIVETANEGIFIIDAKTIVTYANKKMTDMLGYALEEVVGRDIWDFISEEDKDTIKLNQDRRRQGINESYELKLICKGGSSIWVLISAKSLFDKDGKFVGSISMLTDITKRKEAEEALANIETARKKEIHHRIKNNLQVISSLLELQAEKFNNREDIKDSEVLEAFRESQDRVISMALIHKELYKGGGFDKLNFSSYIEELAENLFHTYSLGKVDINLKMDLEENIFFDMDTAVPLGMIVNELVSNSLKHAFTEEKEGEIRIKLCREEKGNEMHKSLFSLTISDNGKGIPENPENIELESFESLGLQLVSILVDQLDGEIELERDRGTKFRIMFKVAERL